MERNRAKFPFESMTDAQFLNGLLQIIEHSLFVDRERLLVLLATDTDRDTLTEVFRRCFEGYYLATVVVSINGIHKPISDLPTSDMPGSN